MTPSPSLTDDKKELVTTEATEEDEEEETEVIEEDTTIEETDLLVSIVNRASLVVIIVTIGIIVTEDQTTEMTGNRREADPIEAVRTLDLADRLRPERNQEVFPLLPLSLRRRPPPLPLLRYLQCVLSWCCSLVHCLWSLWASPRPSLRYLERVTPTIMSRMRSERLLPRHRVSLTSVASI